MTGPPRREERRRARRIGRLGQAFAMLGAAFAMLGALALLGIGILLSLHIDRMHQAERLDALSAQAHVLAATATAALTFHDHQAAQEYVDALRVNRQIAAIGLYDASGTLFAGFSRQSPTSLPATLHGGIPRRASGLLADELLGDGLLGDGLLNMTARVRQGGTVLGLVLLQTQAEPLGLRLQRYGPIMLLLAMAALLVGVLGFAQSALRRANAMLTAHARDLAAANRNLQDQIAQREQMEATLRQAQKMDAIGQLTGGIAHDFNNLLQVVLGSLERLRIRAGRAGRQLDPDLDRLVESATQAGLRAATLTQRLLAFSRRQPLAPKPVDPNRLVSGMSDLLARTLGESIEMEVVLAGDLWPVLADENQLENALLNLAVNARDAMPKGGRLTIETANTHLDEAYARAEQEVKPGPYVLLAVTDTGCGMPPEVLAKAFDPFFTTKGIGQGTGLGLSQVYGFIKQSGGHTRLYSEPGRGTTIRMYLPRLLAAAADDGGEAGAPPAPRGSSRECILVVEDEESVRALSVDMLQDLGYGVLQAADGPSALAVLEREPSIDLLFTDIGLPNGMTGRQLAAAAHQIRPRLKVLLTTGYAREAFVHEGRLDPDVDLIGKPFAAADLGRRVRVLLDASRSPVAGRPPR